MLKAAFVIIIDKWLGFDHVNVIVSLKFLLFNSSFKDTLQSDSDTKWLLNVRYFAQVKFIIWHFHDSDSYCIIIYGTCIKRMEIM